jgi:hypothetical protein
MYANLECHDPIKYRKKIKGFHMAFNIRDKGFRIPINEETVKFNKANKKQSSEEVRKISID